MKSLGLIVTHPDGRTEKLRDNGDGSYTNEMGERIVNPTFYEGCHVAIVPELIRR